MGVINLINKSVTAMIHPQLKKKKKTFKSKFEPLKKPKIDKSPQLLPLLGHCISNNPNILRLLCLPMLLLLR